jgi:hypothetical protein
MQQSGTVGAKRALEVAAAWPGVYCLLPRCWRWDTEKTLTDESTAALLYGCSTSRLPYSTDVVRGFCGMAQDPPGTCRAASKPAKSPMTVALGTPPNRSMAHPIAVTRTATAILLGELRLQSMAYWNCWVVLIVPGELAKAGCQAKSE